MKPITDPSALKAGDVIAYFYRNRSGKYEWRGTVIDNTHETVRVAWDHDAWPEQEYSHYFLLHGDVYYPHENGVDNCGWYWREA